MTGWYLKPVTLSGSGEWSALRSASFKSHIMNVDFLPPQESSYVVCCVSVFSTM